MLGVACVTRAGRDSPSRVVGGVERAVTSRNGADTGYALQHNLNSILHFNFFREIAIFQYLFFRV